MTPCILYQGTMSILSCRRHELGFMALVQVHDVSDETLTRTQGPGSRARTHAERLPTQGEGSTR